MLNVDCIYRLRKILRLSEEMNQLPGMVNREASRKDKTLSSMAEDAYADYKQQTSISEHLQCKNTIYYW